MIKPIALGLATGIAFDAFLVRMTLGPALMALMGRAAWWMPAWLGKLLPNVDIEGESLREHIADAAWAREQRGTAITADELVVGAADNYTGHRVGPFSFAVPEGGMLLASGPAHDRRLLASTLAGRLDVVDGRAQVSGHPLPSERERVARRVAMIDVGGMETTALERSSGNGAWREPSWRMLIEERVGVTLPWYRAWMPRRVAADWMHKVTEAIDGITTVRINPNAGLRNLPPVERAIALAGVALAEKPAIAMFDVPESFVSHGEWQRFLDAVAAMAPASTTILVGSSAPFGVTSVAAREVIKLDVGSAFVPTGHSNTEGNNS